MTIATVTVPAGSYIVFGISQISDTSNLIYNLTIDTQTVRFSGEHGGGAVVTCLVKCTTTKTLELKMVAGGTPSGIYNSNTRFQAVKISNDVS